MHNLALFALLFFGLAINANAQDNKPIQDPEAKKILDAVSTKYRAMKSFKASFRRTIKSNSGDIYGSQNGNIVVNNTKFHMTIDELEVFCDGKTVWTYMKDVGEVNVNHYEKDGQEVTPNTIYDIYKKGYKYVLYGTKNFQGGLTHIMDLEPIDYTSEIMKIRIWVRKDSHEIVQWIVFQRGSNDRQVFDIQNFQANVPVDKGMFMFDKSKHPKVDVIDLR